jgi:hypothetical protein
MKKFWVISAVFAVIFFLFSCDSGTTTDISQNDSNESENSENSESDTPEQNGNISENENSSDDDTDNTEQPDDSDTQEDDRKQGDLYGECYPNETCNNGLVCDVENNICIKDSDNSNENNEPEENPCKNNPCSGISNSTGVCNSIGNNKYSCGCYEHYTWNGSYCKADSRTVNCTGLPANATWNTYSSITQTWNGYDWYPPLSSGTYNKTAKENECRFICKENYTWNYSECIADTRPQDCENLPNNAQWNTVSSITQTWNGYNWYPSSIGSYNETSSTDECRFICDSGYNWNGSVCKTKPTLAKICTNQNSCYTTSTEIPCPTLEEDFFGQDAQNSDKCLHQNFEAGTGERTGTVIDHNTNLIWEQSPSTDTYTWNNRQKHCDDLNALNYGGLSNWRVPNPLEFLTIVDNSRYNPATNSNFTNMPTSNEIFFWTSKQWDSSSAYYFSAYFGEYFGNIISDEGYLTNSDSNKTKSYKILCVSGDELLPLTSNDFEETSITVDQTTYSLVRDKRTELVWLKLPKGLSFTWKKALKYCSDSNLLGYTWRLPNKNELAHLLNHDKETSPRSYFPAIEERKYWSSSTKKYKYNNDDYSYPAWIVNFKSNYVSSMFKDSSAAIMCVRNTEE